MQMQPHRQRLRRVPRVRYQATVDALTKAIIETIGAARFTVQLYCQGGQNVVEAVDEKADETFVVRGRDLYLVVVELAQQCGIELEDG